MTPEVIAEIRRVWVTGQIGTHSHQCHLYHASCAIALLLAALCPPCHTHIHDHPAESYADGWLIHWENAS